MARLLTLPARAVWHALFWTFDRATWQYDLMVIAILAFVWLTPPDWIGDPDGHRPRTDRPPSSSDSGRSPRRQPRGFATGARDSAPSHHFPLVGTEIESLPRELDVVGGDLVSQQTPHLAVVLLRHLEMAHQVAPRDR